ncbi:MAG: response regulator [Gemmatimonadetes bacterium]|nr:response regulator [Gemmatimonadota bacterium]
MAAAVLIVEDVQAIREVFTRILRRAGFEVTAVEDGIAALTEIARRDFQAVISDYSMPALGGRGFFEQLEERFPATAARVVFVTAFAEDSQIREFLDQTGQPVLGKPVEISELVEVVRRVAGRGPSGGYPVGA